MKKFLILIFSLFASLIVLSFAEDPTSSTLSVYVQTQAGVKVSGINIAVTGTGYNQAQNTNTDGKATFTITQNGEYQIIINLSEGSQYELVSGETATKSTTIVLGTDKAIYYGVQAKETQPTEEKFDANIPATFYESGSATTKFTDITKADLENVSNFIIEIPDMAKIVYSEDLNLSSDESIAKLKKLDQYVFMEQPGEVAVAADLFPELDAPAKITFYNVNFIEIGENYSPAIVKDDRDTSQAKNIKLVNTSTISFEVLGFSVYAVRPTIQFDEDEIETNEANYELKGKIDDLDSELNVFINDEKSDIELTIEDDGSFTIPLELDKQDNLIQVIATGISEQSFGETIEVKFLGGENTDNDSQSISTLLLLAMIIVAVIGVGIPVGYFVYKKRKAKKLKIKTNINKGFDQRLLTPEEKQVYGSGINDHEAGHDEADKVPELETHKEPKDKSKAQEDQTPKM